MPTSNFFEAFKNRVRVEHLFLIILIAAIILRFAFLDLKLFHHDEAIHAWFSYELLTKGTYIYDPVYHGPFLYYITATMFAIFGDSDLVGRILPSLFGCAIIPLVYALYKMGYLNGKVSVAAALFIAVAPQMVYFSRFLRNDIFVIFFSLLLVIAFLAWIQKEKWYYLALAGFSGALGMCCKENMPIILVMFGVFFLYLVWTRKVTLPAKWLRDFAVAFVIFFGVIFAFYSSFGMHPEMILNAGPMAIEHWLNMHGQERLGGPPYFYLMLFVLYEVPILLLAIAGVVLFIVQPGKSRKKEETIFESAEGEEVQARKEKPSLLSIFQRPAAPPVINRQEEFIRFAIYWMIIALLTYAYIGEKVPWLSLHQLLPMIFVAAYALLFAGKYAKVLLAVSVVFLLAVTLHVAFTPADISEPIVQVQYSEDLRPLMAAIDAADKVAIASDQGWPLTWYYRGEKWDKISYFGKKIPENSIASGNYDIVLMHDGDSYDSLPGYEKETIRLSYWIDWQATLKDPGLLVAYFTRQGQFGTLNTDVFTKAS